MENEIARKLCAFLNPIDDLPKTDLILGFGHFDLRIPDHCGKLLQDEMGKKNLFTGGYGVGSGNFKEAEAIEFKKILTMHFPDEFNYLYQKSFILKR